MKQTLQKEYLRHQRDMERLTADLHGATLAQEEARGHLRSSWEAVAAHGQPPPATMEPADSAWESMLAGWQAEQQETVASHAVLRRALSAAAQTDSRPRGGDADELFHTPPRKASAAPPMTPPAVTSATPPGLSRMTDPYMTSPGQPAMPNPGSEQIDVDLSEDQSTSPAPKTRPKPTEPRTPVKKLPGGVHHSGAPTHSDLADKLEQKRALHQAALQGSAMQPFRFAASGPPTHSGHDPPPTTRNLLEGCTEIDSEDDVILAAPHKKPEAKME